MANTLSPQAIAQLFAQESSDPFLTLVTLTHDSFPAPIYLVNNTENILSRGLTFLAFPMMIRFPVDDGETTRQFSIDFDNVSLDLIVDIRSAVTPVGVKIEMILASMPDDVQMVQDELEIAAVSYDALRITATIVLDNFLNTEVTSERYGVSNFPGVF